ncbi:hypothetical protein [Flavivirga sp. 57AJ16]|uniref:hypothetical protein n=1 Tax=Flavivirga sp. 57AJ16 TaxID=3025307 RepID=UPI002366DA50|nr:hypothetical protein [Flavivirga sp. 57AJ16]MDD7885474.1 hypothetical protein [Flavivirga sp. 57AJ16]
MKYLRYKLVFIFFVLIISNHKVKAQNFSETQKLYSVVNIFKTSFYDSTKEQEFYDLFLHDSITWASVYEGKTKEFLKTKEDYQHFFSGNFMDFYEYLKREGNCEEDFYNLVINVDNNHATISFEYTFKKKNEIQNWGKEYWTLLKVDGNWKIAAVLWTMNYQNIEKCPFVNNSYYNKF